VQKARPKPPAEFFGQVAQVELEEERQRLLAVPAVGPGASGPVQGVPPNFEAITGPSPSSTVGFQAGRRCFSCHGSSFLMISSVVIA
jgi:hypothetical protein